MGTIDHNEVLDFSIYPNPTTSWINLRIDLESAKKAVLNIVQVDGKQVKQEQLINGNNRISLNDLGVGNYFFIVNDGRKNLISGSLNKLSVN